MNNKLNEFLDKIELIQHYTDYPMKDCTTFHIGGNADIFVIPHNESEIIKVIQLCKEMDIDLFIMGNGSNLLVRDKGIRGVVMQIGKAYGSFVVDNETVTVQSGISNKQFSNLLYANCLTGYEFASGIPGTVGGAVAMNAGAYGYNISDVIVKAKVVDRNGNIRIVTKEDMDLGYRTSKVLEKNCVVLSATFKFTKDTQENIKSRIDEYTEKRVSKQPLDKYSAGSTFKRPEGYFAGKLIQDSNLKGVKIKNAQVSEKHSGFIINTGNATCQEIIDLIEFVKQTVYNNFHVKLEEEVRIIGEK